MRVRTLLCLALMMAPVSLNAMPTFQEAVTACAETVVQNDFAPIRTIGMQVDGDPQHSLRLETASGTMTVFLIQHDGQATCVMWGVDAPGSETTSLAWGTVADEAEAWHKAWLTKDHSGVIADNTNDDLPGFASIICRETGEIVAELSTPVAQYPQILPTGAKAPPDLPVDERPILVSMTTPRSTACGHLVHRENN